MENTENKKKNIFLDLIRILIAVDIGVVVFCYLENNMIWLYNTQLAFFSTSLIILGAFIGYSNSVKAQLENGNVGEDILKKYDDKFDLYDEDDKIDEENLKRVKPNKLKWYEALFFSFKGGFNFLRILGYIFLIASFIYLSKLKIFDVVSFLFGVSIVPTIALFYSFILKRKFN